jgi:hypothetical protein
MAAMNDYKTPRGRKDTYHAADDKIPLSAWIVGLTLLALVFAFFPLLSLVMQ